MSKPIGAGPVGGMVHAVVCHALLGTRSQSKTLDGEISWAGFLLPEFGPWQKIGIY